MEILQQRLAGHVQGRRLWNEEYVYALKGAQIGLCFLSDLNYNDTTVRSFEIPACGTFMLALRTPQHLDCYVEGQEAAFFDTPEELVQKARYYLEHDEERRAIARRGHQRCVESGYCWTEIMRRDWAKVLAAYGKRAASSPR